MKLDKNKLIFSALLFCIFLFIAGYAMLVLGEDEEPTIENNQIPVPELEGEQKQYSSKLDALNDLKEVRETNAPSIYDERLLDSTGVYDPDLLNKKKIQIVDSIYQQGQMQYSERTYGNSISEEPSPELTKREGVDSKITIQAKEMDIEAKELALEHQLFFASHPIENYDLKSKLTDDFIYVQVDGTQTVKTNYRLQMRLLKDATIYGKLIPKNASIYGFVSFKPNRTIIEIENINHDLVKLTAHDFQDGSQGIYVENSFQAEFTNQVMVDMVDDINIAGVPQVSGFKRIFQRNHRNVKVTITDNYLLILKVDQSQF